MIKSKFFKLTPLYKEFIILDYIEKYPDITQRKISEMLGIAVSMVNLYLDTYEQKGHISREHYSTKNIRYCISKIGIERKKFLNFEFLHASQSVYNTAKENVLDFLSYIIHRGLKKILLYGAGEVAEILLQVINGDHTIPLDAVAIIDDDKTKHGKKIINSLIVSFDEIQNIEHDGILISSYNNEEIIYKKLLKNNYDENHIIRLFTN